jgi:hypothetical protein
MAKNPKILTKAEQISSQLLRPPFFFLENPSLNAFHQAPGACSIAEDAFEPPAVASRAKGSVRFTSSRSIAVN